MTQKELSKLLFVSESAVSKWEKDIAHPDITLLPKISELLGVTEHELITASIDNHAREEKVQAKKWRVFSLSWSLFFYISYGVALIPCFICNIAINHTLSWFWIVLSSLLLAFTFTNLPGIIKRYKLIFLPLSNFLALCILLAICAIYTEGDWFWIVFLSVLLGMVIIFTPIYIAKYDAFSKVKRFGDFVSIGIDFIMLNILLIAINIYTGGSWWYITVALPIVAYIYLALNLIISVRLFKTNRFFKTSIILLLVDVFMYIPPLLLKVQNPSVQEGINGANIFKADFSNWTVDVTLENNIHCIVFLTILATSLVLLIPGLVRHSKRNSIK
ncbi:MAG: helix-turn-helix domain-containing protein [Clostridia bacterium]|nr:helix-turn-helix domain-containing protein [Clostridia bacterium]